MKLKGERPKFLISADIEGITGVVDGSFTKASGKNYAYAQKYMMSDVNAVIEGILEANAKSLIFVKDAHGDTFNLNLEDLHPRATLVQGWGTTMSMIHPMDESFDALYMVGYHGNGRSQVATMAHTYASIFEEVKLNGETINEGTIAGILALNLKAPPIFLAGDNIACEEIVKDFPWIKTYFSKVSLARNSSYSVGLEEAFLGIKENSFIATREFLKGNVKFNFDKFKEGDLFEVEIKLSAIAFKTSNYEMMKGTFSFMDILKFNDEKLSLSYRAKSVKDFFGYFNMICSLYYGLRDGL